MSKPNVLILLQTENQMANLGLDQTDPVHVLLLSSSTGYQHYEMFVLLEKVSRFEESVPAELVAEYVIANVECSLYFIDHDRSSRVGDIECRVLLRVGRRDYWH